ncbi:hypothetical protein AGMMS50256_22860 [Betaproteobacteria bacterium]|nr:hypothetical protein AGMMS50256_22860 [Betaproteobacteria bacterium]
MGGKPKASATRQLNENRTRLQATCSTVCFASPSRYAECFRCFIQFVFSSQNGCQSSRMRRYAAFPIRKTCRRTAQVSRQNAAGANGALPFLKASRNA